jgi:hypothetical protein
MSTGETASSSGETLELPKSVVGRLAKRGVPTSDNVLIATESKQALSKSAKMFILYLSAWYVLCIV